MRPAHGAALLLVIGATAALGTLAALLLSFSLLAYEAAVLRSDGAQARLLAMAALLEVEEELRHGRLGVPAAGIVWQATMPTAPQGIEALPVAPEPHLLLAPGSGCGASVHLSMVMGPDGDPRGMVIEGEPEAAVLIDALAAGWCGRAAAEAVARFAVVPGSASLRLY